MKQSSSQLERNHTSGAAIAGRASLVVRRLQVQHPRLHPQLLQPHQPDQQLPQPKTRMLKHMVDSRVLWHCGALVTKRQTSASRLVGSAR